MIAKNQKFIFFLGSLLIGLTLLTACGDNNGGIKISNPNTASGATATSSTGATTVAPTVVNLPTVAGDTPTVAAKSTATVATKPTVTTGTSKTTPAGKTTPTPSSNGGSDMIPPYTGATSISNPAVFRQSFESSYLKSIGGTADDFLFSYYATDDSSEDILAYYDDAVEQTGYTKSVHEDLPATSFGSGSIKGTTTVYVQGKLTIYQVVVLGPFDATSAKAIGGGLGDGQNLIITAQGAVSGGTGSTGTVTTPAVTKGSPTKSGSGTASSGSSVAVYPGFKPITAPTLFSQPFQESYLKTLGASLNTGGFQFNYYITSDDSDQILSYYDGATKPAGYTKTNSKAIDPIDLGSGSVGGNTSVYAKDATGGNRQLYQVLIFGPLDDDTAETMSSTGQTFEAGDSLVIVIEGTITGS